MDLYRAAVQYVVSRDTRPWQLGRSLLEQPASRLSWVALVHLSNPWHGHDCFSAHMLEEIEVGYDVSTTVLGAGRVLKE